MELYTIPIEDDSPGEKLILYRPLLGLACVGNRAMADLAQRLAEGAAQQLPSALDALREPIRRLVGRFGVLAVFVLAVIPNPLFDLAAVESRIDDTRKATFRKDGKDYELLRRGFTDDGGHLNSAGRQVVAIELLRSLAGL